MNFCTNIAFLAMTTDLTDRITGHRESEQEMDQADIIMERVDLMNKNMIDQTRKDLQCKIQRNLMLLVILNDLNRSTGMELIENDSTIGDQNLAVSVIELEEAAVVTTEVEVVSEVGGIMTEINSLNVLTRIVHHRKGQDLMSTRVDLNSDLRVMDLMTMMEVISWRNQIDQCRNVMALVQEETSAVDVVAEDEVALTDRKGEIFQDMVTGK